MKLLLVPILVILSAHATADLLVVPSEKESGRTVVAPRNAAVHVAAPKVVKASPLSSENGVDIQAHIVKKPIAVRVYASKGANGIGSQGRDVLLSMVLDGFYSDSDGWVVNVQRGIPSDFRVSWDTNNDTAGAVMQAISLQNNLFIAVDEAERAVGVGTTTEIAPFLAKRVPLVWYADKPSVKLIIEDWAAQAGMEVLWRPKKDHRVVAKAVLGGAIDDALETLLESLIDTELPLHAKIRQNRVIEIVEGGWEALN